MKTDMLSRERLAELIAGFSAARIAVVGDFFLDKYLEINPAWEEPSLETGKPAHQVAGIHISPGAAGTVISNLAALGAGKLYAVGLTGDDGEGYELRRALQTLDCETKHLAMDAQRFTPTYLKPRDQTRPGLEGEHSRYDTKNRTPTLPAIEQSILNSLENLLPQVDAVVILDQVEQENCGVITTRIRQAISRLAQENPRMIFWADSRRHIWQFQHIFTKPNQYELMKMDSPPAGLSIRLEQLLAMAQQLYQETQSAVFVTRGDQGMLVQTEVCTQIPGLRVHGPLDPTGAGDSTTAGCVLALCAGASPVEAAVVGNLVASLTVQQLSTTGTASPQQLPPQWEKWTEQNSPSQ